MNTFQDMELPQLLKEKLAKIGFENPTPIQEQAIPIAMAGKDIVGSAQTGTGKTGAFGIPLAAKLLLDENSMALVITPTRELATQVLKQLDQLLGRDSGVRSVLLIGGEAMHFQLRQLKGNPRLVVGTPGRINYHIERRSLKLDNTNFLVMDETDRMMDMGFSEQIDNIVNRTSPERQTLLFSATMPKKIVQIAQKYLTNPEQITVGVDSSAGINITQENIEVEDHKKQSQLLEEIEKREGSILIFVRTKFSAEKMADRLYDEGFKADAIHGNLKQSRRDKVIRAFREKKYRILVGTDVAARGLDIPHIEHVINYDLPECPEDYIHRIGRTGRAGATGTAVNFITRQDKRKWQAIERILDPSKKHEKDDAPQRRRGGGGFRDRRSGGRSSDSFGGRGRERSGGRRNSRNDRSY